MRRLVFTAAFLLLAAGPAHATLHYVSTDGDDTANTCLSAATPCASIGHAFSLMVDGDSILASSGNYDENVIVTNLGFQFFGGFDEAFMAQDLAKPSVIRGKGGRAMEIAYNGSDSANVLINNIAFTKSATPLDAPDPFAAAGAGLRISATDTTTVHVTLVYTSFSKNSASIGAGLALETRVDAQVSLELTDSSITKNKGASCGGVSVHAFGVYAPSLIVSGGVMEKNKVTDSGGAFCYSVPQGFIGSFEFIDARFAKNKAARFGGAVLVDARGGGGELVLRNCQFLKNSSKEAGGAIRLITSPGMTGDNGEALLTSYNNTFSKNKSALGGGISMSVAASGIFTNADGQWMSRNDIVYGNKGGDAHIEAETGTTASVNRFDGIQGPVVTVGAGVSSIDTNIQDVDPMLTKPGADVHLLPGSPAIDAVACTDAPFFDFEGDVRPAGSQCDIGADEATAP